jgi:hypothetical protein
LPRRGSSCLRCGAIHEALRCVYRVTSPGQGTSSSSPGLLLLGMLRSATRSLRSSRPPRSTLFAVSCWALVGSARYELQGTAPLEGVRPGPLPILSAAGSLLPATPGRPAALRSACRCPAAGPRPASPGACPLARPALWRAPSHPPAARAGASAGLSAPRSFSARSLCPDLTWALPAPHARSCISIQHHKMWTGIPCLTTS